MIVEVKTVYWHEFNEDGSERKEHCCGCWNFQMDTSDPQQSHTICNECGERREMVAYGITRRAALNPSKPGEG